MAKSLQRVQSREFRKQGLSLKAIAKKLNVSVASASNWCRDVVLTEEQCNKLQENSRDPYYGRRSEYLSKIMKSTDEKIVRLKDEGISEVGSISSRELFLIGIALYWSEGFKKDSQVGFANSDPAMINLFLKWLYVCFGYTPTDLLPRVTLNISHKERTNMVIKYWSKVTSIPFAQFRKPFYQNVKWQKVYENPEEYFGVLRIKVRKSKDFLRKIHGFIEGLRLQV